MWVQGGAGAGITQVNACMGAWAAGQSTFISRLASGRKSGAVQSILACCKRLCATGLATGLTPRPGNVQFELPADATHGLQAMLMLAAGQCTIEVADGQTPLQHRSCMPARSMFSRQPAEAVAGNRCQSMMSTTRVVTGGFHTSGLAMQPGACRHQHAGMGVWT